MLNITKEQIIDNFEQLAKENPAELEDFMRELLNKDHARGIIFEMLVENLQAFEGLEHANKFYDINSLENTLVTLRF